MRDRVIKVYVSYAEKLKLKTLAGKLSMSAFLRSKGFSSNGGTKQVPIVAIKVDRPEQKLSKTENHYKAVIDELKLVLKKID